MIQSCLFRQVFVNYLMSILIYANKQVGTSIKMSLGHSPSLLLVQKYKPEKLIFIVANNWIKLAVWWSRNLVLPKKWQQQKTEATTRSCSKYHDGCFRKIISKIVFSPKSYAYKVSVFSEIGDVPVFFAIGTFYNVVWPPILEKKVINLIWGCISFYFTNMQS